MTAALFNRYADLAAHQLADAGRYLAADGFGAGEDRTGVGFRRFAKADESGAPVAYATIFLRSLGAPAEMDGQMMFSRPGGGIDDLTTVADYVREKALAETRNPIVRFIKGFFW